MLNLISLYWHTLRYLKFSQILNRVIFYLHKPKPILSLPPLLRLNSKTWVTTMLSAPSLVGPEEFVFFGVRGSLETFGWHGPNREKLWRYNQHYFNDLNSRLAIARYQWHLNLLENWIKQNPPACGVGWDPYPTSLRVVNWIKWSLSKGFLSDSCIQSLAIQVRYLFTRLEFHLLGNHIIANAKALIFTGLFFKGSEADKWLDSGLAILKRELSEQILRDGGHFELSPMYHSVVLEDILDLINASQIWPGCIERSTIDDWKVLAGGMLAWLGKMTHPDGEISLFNDAAINIAAPPKDLLIYARLLGIETNRNLMPPPLLVEHLEYSGYIQLTTKNAVAILDVAHVGPDYLPGHAHADTLSFELSIYGQRLIVNGGTSQYGLNQERFQERQTKNHSTVEVGGVSSSEVWSGFRVARRAKPINLKIIPGLDEVLIRCEHNGYSRLKGSPIHCRQWTMALNSLDILDTVLGGAHKSIARFIFHPTVRIEKRSFNSWILHTSNGNMVSVDVAKGDSFLDDATYAPEFGCMVKTRCLGVQLKMGQSQVKLEWT